MAKSVKDKERVSSPCKDTNWEICGYQFVTERGKNKGLENGSSGIHNNLFEEMVNQMDTNGNVLVRAEDNNVMIENGKVVARTNVNGNILTGKIPNKKQSSSKVDASRGE